MSLISHLLVPPGNPNAFAHWNRVHTLFLPHLLNPTPFQLAIPPTNAKSACKARKRPRRDEPSQDRALGALTSSRAAREFEKLPSAQWSLWRWLSWAQAKRSFSFLQQGGRLCVQLNHIHAGKLFTKKGDNAGGPREWSEYNAFRHFLSSIPAGASLLFTDGSFVRGERGAGCAAVLIESPRGEPADPGHIPSFVSVAVSRLPDAESNAEAEIGGICCAVSLLRQRAAAISARPIVLCSDSQYALGAISGWTRVEADHERILQIRAHLKLFSRVVLRYVPAHLDRAALGHPAGPLHIPGNEFVDSLASRARENPAFCQIATVRLNIGLDRVLNSPEGRRVMTWASGPEDATLPYSYKFITPSLLVSLVRNWHASADAREWITARGHGSHHHVLEPIAAQLSNTPWRQFGESQGVVRDMLNAKFNSFTGVNAIRERFSSGAAPGSGSCPICLSRGAGRVPETQMHLLGSCAGYRAFYTRRHDELVQQLVVFLRKQDWLMWLRVHTSMTNRLSGMGLPDELVQRGLARWRTEHPGASPAEEAACLQELKAARPDLILQIAPSDELKGFELRPFSLFAPSPPYPADCGVLGMSFVAVEIGVSTASTPEQWQAAFATKRMQYGELCRLIAIPCLTLLFGATGIVPLTTWRELHLLTMMRWDDKELIKSLQGCSRKLHRSMIQLFKMRRSQQL